MAKQPSPSGSRPAPPADEPAEGDRREFMTKAAAVAAGGIVGLCPAAAGLVSLCDPLDRKSAAGGLLRVATLDVLADDGTPQFFQVIADKQDAWNRFPKEPLGGVFLRKTPEGGVECLQATCPHAGCFVDYVSDKGIFKCPCHNSRFEPDGKRIDPEKCPSPRDMDTLAVDEAALRQTGEVLVHYQNFRGGTAEKVPEA